MTEPPFSFLNISFYQCKILVKGDCIIMSENKSDILNIGTAIGNILKDVKINTNLLTRKPSYGVMIEPAFLKNPTLEFAKEHRKEEKMYWDESISLLKNIEVNTANLTTIVNLISTNNDKQDEIINIITDLFSLAKETDKDVALSKYRNVMKTINEFSGDADTLLKLSSYGGTIGMILKTLGIL